MNDLHFERGIERGELPSDVDLEFRIWQEKSKFVPVATINGVVFANGGPGAFPPIAGSSARMATPAKASWKSAAACRTSQTTARRRR